MIWKRYVGISNAIQNNKATRQSRKEIIGTWQPTETKRLDRNEVKKAITLCVITVGHSIFFIFWPRENTFLGKLFWTFYMCKLDKLIDNKRPWTAPPVTIWVRWQLHICNDAKLINIFSDWNLSKCGKQYFISLDHPKTPFFRHNSYAENSSLDT